MKESSKRIIKIKKVNFKIWNGRDIISDECDLFVIGGAGIIKLKPLKIKKCIMRILE